MFDGLYTDALAVSPYLDHTKTDMVWSIGAGPSTNYSPNVLSELSFDQLKSRGWGLNIAYLNKLNNKWAFNLEGDYFRSSIKKGDIQDSDYEGDDRTEEFSRSYSDASGDALERKQTALGFKYRWFDTKGHYLGLMIGRHDFDFDVNMTNGVQIVPLESNGLTLAGLDSTYDSRFLSTFAAVTTEHVFNWGTVGFRYEKHDVEFDAKANWNLRSEFAHPVSFAHTGEGDGETLTLGYTYTVTKAWDVYVNWSRRQIEISDGYDHTFFVDGSSIVLRLNNVDYDSESMQGGVRYIF